MNIADLDLDDDHDLFTDIFKDDEFFEEEAPPLKRPRVDDFLRTPGTPLKAVGTPIRSAHVTYVSAKDSATSRVWHSKGKLGPGNPSFPTSHVRREEPPKPVPQPEEGHQLNEFERALIRVKGPRRGPEHITDVAAQMEAQAIVDDMKKAAMQDEEARRNNFPSVGKMLILRSIVARILREKIAEYFVECDGIGIIFDWISPTPGIPEKFAHPAPDIVLLMLKVLHRMPMTRCRLIESKIGVSVKMIWMSKRHKPEIRRQAEMLCMKWLEIIQKPYEEEDEIELPESKKTDVADSGEIVIPPRLTARRDPNFWVPTAEQVEKDMRISRQRRHAAIPMEKPLFSKEHLPTASDVQSKVGWNRTNPETTMGKVERRVQSMTNPNKKAWKSAVSKPVSVTYQGMGQVID